MKSYSIGTRTLALLLCAVLLFSLAPVQFLVRAEDEEPTEPSPYGAVSVLGVASDHYTLGDDPAAVSIELTKMTTFTQTLDDPETEEVEEPTWGTVAVRVSMSEKLTADLAKEDLTEEQQNALVEGIRVLFPADSTAETQEANWVAWKALAGENNYIELSVNVEDLFVPDTETVTLADLETEWIIDWDGDGDGPNQTVHLTLAQDKVIMKSAGHQIFPVLGKVGCDEYEGAQLIGDETDRTIVTVPNPSLEWEKNADSTDEEDVEWWATFTVDAPVKLDNASGATVNGKAFNVEEGAETEGATLSGNQIQLKYKVADPETTESEVGTNFDKEFTIVWEPSVGGYESVNPYVQKVKIQHEGNITLNKKDQPEFKFTTETPADITFKNPMDPYENPAIDDKGDGTVTYAITEGSDVADINTATGVVTFTEAGQITVTATKAENKAYNATTIEYTVKAVKSVQTGFGFQTPAPAAITYAPGLTFNNPASGGNTGGSVTYEIVSQQYGGDDATVASIDADTGLLTISQSGTVTVRATKEGNELYEDATAEYTLIINKAQQSDFEFTKDAETVTYNHSNISHTKTVSGGKTSSAPVYAVVEGEGSDPAVATVDASTGEITIKQAGTVKIKATKEGDECYEAAEAVYTLTVNKDNQSVSFADGTNVSKLYGTKEYTNPVTFEKEGGSGDVTYKIEDNTIGATVDETTGKVTFSDSEGKVGKATVMVTRAADSRYNKISAFYTITLSYEEKPETQCTLSGQTKNDSGWYTGNVTVTAPTGYTISKTNALSTTDWAASVEFSDECNGTAAHTVYLKKTSTETVVGGITDAIPIPNLKIDKTAPVAEMTFVPTADITGKKVNVKQEATVSITEANFDPAGVALTISLVDINGKTVGVYEAPTLQTEASWTADENNAAVHTARIPFSVDGTYSITLQYTDPAGNTSTQLTNTFTLDTAGPEVSDVEYQVADTESMVQYIWNSIFFVPQGETQTVIMKASDTSAGVKSFAITVTPDPDFATATDIVMPEDLVVTLQGGGVGIAGSAGFIQNVTAVKETDAENKETGLVTLSFDVPAQFRGTFSYTATDDAGNTSDVGISQRILVVDTIAPTRKAVYTPDRVVQKSDMKNATAYAEGDASVLYYKQDAVITFTVTEANFYGDDVKFTVQRNGADYKDFVVSEWTGAKNESGAAIAGAYERTLTLKDEGDYVVTMNYTDKSQNEMVEYVSPEIIVDKTAPVISVSYDQTAPKNTVGGRKYFTGKMTATVQITEHNFRPDDVLVKVDAKDYLGTNVLELNNDGTVKTYAADGADRSKWTAFESGTWRREDDTYTLQLVFTADANYTLDVDYMDLATNAAADYTPDLFTVDNTNPTDLKISYSTSVLDQMAGAVTFGYYKEPVTVTISARDVTSGIHRFEYSYVKASGVSAVNAELLNQAIADGSFTRDGNSATATFKVPKGALTANNQFNGTVNFSAVDRSENKTSLNDSRRLVVDNISPNCTVVLDTPVKIIDDNHYYRQDIKGTITIVEANFDSADVRVNVTLDGQPYAAQVSWTSSGNDTHVGTFTLPNSGTYVVSVSYSDKSGNAAANYKSANLVLDKVLPTINVSKIKNNSANKDEVFSFTITARDINIDEATFVPVLMAVVRTDEGKYETKQIELGDMVTVVGGVEYRFEIADLKDDALYTLTAAVKDLAGNETKLIGLEDEQTYETVQFSINRKGSIFIYGNDYTKKIVDRYYVYSVSQDLVLEEINVDPIEKYEVLLNGRVLKEGTDYTSVLSGNVEEWSKRTYTLNKSLFEEEGEYNVVINSTDKANTTAYSDVKNLVVAFVVDQTKPVVTIAGMETGGRYQTGEQVVTLIPTDEGGLLRSLKVIIMDSNGKPITNSLGEDISVRFAMDGLELLQYLDDNNGVITYTIPEGLNCKVRVICNDSATDDSGNTNTYDMLFERVTVSQNGFVIFYANTPLFIGTILGVLGVITGLVIFLVKRRKKDEEA